MILEFGVSKIMVPNMNMKQIKIIIEKHADGYVAYPIGLKGVIVGQGDSYDETLTDVKSAIAFHIETFGQDIILAHIGK